MILNRDKVKMIWEISILTSLIALLLFSSMIPLPDDLTSEGFRALLITFIGITLWFTKLLPPAITSMLLICLYPLFGVLSFEVSASSLGEDVIWMIIVMLIMGVAVEETGLDKRIAYFILSFTKSKPKYINLSLIIICFILTFFIPNAIGRVVVLIPIVLGIINTLSLQKGNDLAKSTMISITYTPIICAVSIMTGATGTIYASSLFNSMLDYQWEYMYWIVVMLPPTLITLFIFWIILNLRFPLEDFEDEKLSDFIKKEQERIGPIKNKEVKLLILYFFLITLWVSQGFHGISIPMSAVMVSIFLFVPFIDLLKWNKVIKQVDWGVPLLFAAGFTIALAFENSGIVEWASNLAFNHLSDLPLFILVISLLFLFTLIRVGFTNMTAMIASMMPIALTFALGTEYNSLWIGMICLSACSIGYLFPSQSVGTMTTYSYNYYSSKDLFVTGLYLCFVVYIVIIISAFVYWPLIGLPIVK